MKKVFLYNGFSNAMPEVVVWMIYLQHFGWSTATIALLQGLFTICGAILEFPSGVIADRLGHKKTLLLGEWLCIGYLLTYFVPQFHLLVFVGFILFAFGLALISGTDTSLLYDISEDSAFMKHMGYFNAVGILSVAIGNALGGWLAGISWSLLFLIAIICRLMAIYCISSFKEVENRNNKEEIPNLINHLKLVIQYSFENIKFRYLLMTSAFLMSSITLSYQYIPIILNRLNIGTGSISSIYALVPLLGALLSLLSTKLNSKKIVRGTLNSIYILSVILLSFIGIFYWSPTIIIISFAVPNTLFELSNVIIESTVQEELLDSIRVSSVSLINLIYSTLLSIGSFIIGALSNYFPISMMVGSICVVLMIISFVCYILYEKENR